MIVRALDDLRRPGDMPLRVQNINAISRHDPSTARRSLSSLTPEFRGHSQELTKTELGRVAQGPLSGLNIGLQPGDGGAVNCLYVTK